MKTLHFTLHKKWFDEILAGSKKIEYRDIKPYWTKRLFNDDGTPKNFDEILFRNGYSKNCRKMRVKFLGVKKGKDKVKKKYEIMLGKIKGGRK